MKLDARTISVLRELPIGKLDVIHFDDSLIGFGLRIRASGDGSGGIRRTWVAQYRSPDTGRSRRLKIGAVEVLSPNEAREAARKALAVVALGGDPQAEKIARRQSHKAAGSAAPNHVTIDINLNIPMTGAHVKSGAP